MKARVLMVMSAIVIAFTMFSCSSGEELTSAKVYPGEVLGDADDVFSIASDSCELLRKDGRLRIKVLLELEEPANLEVSVYPVIVLCDEDGVQLVDSWYQMELNDTEKSKFDKFINGNVGDKAEFIFMNEFSYELFDKLLAKSKTFHMDKFSLREQDNATSNSSGIDELGNLINDLEEVYSDVDYDEAMEDAEDALEAAEKALELSNGMMDLLK